MTSCTADEADRLLVELMVTADMSDADEAWIKAMDVASALARCKDVGRARLVDALDHEAGLVVSAALDGLCVQITEHGGPLIPRLVTFLDDPRHDVLAAAIYALWAAGHHVLVDRIEPFAHHVDPGVRRATLAYLSGADPDAHLTTLIAALTDSEPAVRDSAVIRITLTLRDDLHVRALPHIWPMLDDEDFFVRDSAQDLIEGTYWEADEETRAGLVVPNDLVLMAASRLRYTARLAVEVEPERAGALLRKGLAVENPEVVRVAAVDEVYEQVEGNGAGILAVLPDPRTLRNDPSARVRAVAELTRERIEERG